jgi:hypothetical protein
MTKAANSTIFPTPICPNRVLLIALEENVGTLDISMKETNSVNGITNVGSWKSSLFPN